MQPRGRRGKGVILVVDDEAVIRTLVSLALTNAGYIVMEAPDGPEALELSRSYPGAIDLLITDVCMPKMIGPELAKAIAAERPGIRIVMMTGCAEGLVPEERKSELVYKPFRPNDLVSRIESELRNAA